MSDLSTLRSLLDSNLKFSSTTVLPQSERDQAIDSAIDRYSSARPKVQVTAMVANSTGIYELPAAWVNNFSSLREVEYPIEQNPTEYIDPDYTVIEKSPSGYRLKIVYYNPVTGETFWLKYSVPYSFDTSGNAEIPSQDIEGISFLATSFACEKLATYFAEKVSSSLPNADVVDFGNQVEEYSKRASRWLNKYRQAIETHETGVITQGHFTRFNYWNRDNN